MILLLGPLKYDPLESVVSIIFHRIGIATTKIDYLESLKKSVIMLLSTMNVLDIISERVIIK